MKRPSAEHTSMQASSSTVPCSRQVVQCKKKLLAAGHQDKQASSRGRWRVDGVVLHPLEDGAARQHGADDDAQAGLREHDVRRAPRRVRRVRHPDPDVRLLQRGRPQMLFRSCSRRTISYLCSGNMPANPSAFSISSSTAAAAWIRPTNGKIPERSSRSMEFLPLPSSAAAKILCPP